MLVLGVGGNSVGERGENVCCGGNATRFEFPPIALAARFFAYSYDDSAPVYPRAILTDTSSDASLALDRLGDV